MCWCKRVLQRAVFGRRINDYAKAREADREATARFIQMLHEVERRKSNQPISFPDRRSKVSRIGH